MCIRDRSNSVFVERRYMEIVFKAVILLLSPPWLLTASKAAAWSFGHALTFQKYGLYREIGLYLHPAFRGNSETLHVAMKGITVSTVSL